MRAVMRRPARRTARASRRRAATGGRAAARGTAGGTGTPGCRPGRGAATRSRRAAPARAPRRRARRARGPSRWTAGSRTTPPSVWPRPASNCGFTSATIGPPAAEARGDGPEDQGQRDERDVDHGELDGLTEEVRRSACARSCARERRRADRGAADRRAVRDRRRPRRHGRAPRCSSTSVKPPVDAPTSRQTRPEATIANASSAASSLWPPRDTYGSCATSSTGVSDASRSPGLRSVRPESPTPTRTWPASTSACARLRVGSEAPLDEQLIQALAWRAGHASNRGTRHCTPTHLCAHRLGRIHGTSGRRGGPLPRPAPSRASGRRLAGRAGAGVPGVGRARVSRERGERLLDLRRDPGDVESQQPPQIGDRAVVHEPVARDADDPERRLAIAGSTSRASSSTSSTAEPKPPVTTLSSSVTTSRMPRACSRISWRSIGLANRALITPTDQPSAAEDVRDGERAHDDRPEARPAGRRRRRGGTSPRPTGIGAGVTAGTSNPGSRG